MIVGGATISMVADLGESTVRVIELGVTVIVSYGDSVRELGVAVIVSNGESTIELGVPG